MPAGDEAGQLTSEGGVSPFAIGGAIVAWPLAARAQPAVPVIGFLSSLSSSYITSRMPPFRQGLNELGYVEGQNVAIEYRLAEGLYDRLPSLAADLIDRKVAVIVAAGGTDPAKAAKAATATIPIVFISAADAVNAGIVKPQSTGGNVTGVNLLGRHWRPNVWAAQRNCSGAASIGVLINPGFPVPSEVRELRKRQAPSIDKSISCAPVREAEIDTAFTTLAQQQAGRSCCPRYVLR